MALGNIVNIDSSDSGQGFPTGNGKEENAVSTTQLLGCGLEGVAPIYKSRVDSHKGETKVLGLLEVPACLVCEKLRGVKELYTRSFIVSPS